MPFSLSTYFAQGIAADRVGRAVRSIRLAAHAPGRHDGSAAEFQIRYRARRRRQDSPPDPGLVDWQGERVLQQSARGTHPRMAPWPSRGVDSGESLARE